MKWRLHCPKCGKQGGSIVGEHGLCPHCWAWWKPSPVERLAAEYTLEELEKMMAAAKDIFGSLLEDEDGQPTGDGVADEP
jgi:hypothetical protein